MTIERFMADCIPKRNYSELRHLLLEGCNPNALGGKLLLLASQTGSARTVKVLFAHGGGVPASCLVQFVGLAVASASPDALREIIANLDSSRLQEALRESDYAVIVIAGDVCAKAKRYMKAALPLTDAQIKKRRDDLLGDAVRYARFELKESFENIWSGIVKRSRECAWILRNRFMASNYADVEAVETWLKEHTD